MAEELIITISGMRGIVGQSLTAEIAAKYGYAFAAFLKDEYNLSGAGSTVCIGTDSRPSGRMLKFAVMRGLSAAGVDAIDLGMVTTPGVGIMAGHLKCAGGVVITASHNPAGYNGIKLLLGNGIAPDAEKAAKIKQRYLNMASGFTVPDTPAGVSSNEQTDDIHIEKVLAIVDEKLIRKAGYKVVLDSVNGAGGRVGKKLLDKLGCQTIAVNAEPTGDFAHPPEPTAANLTGLCEKIKSERADIGFAQDPDADRLAIVDQAGRYIGEEYTLALSAKYIFGKQPGGAAAANLSTSRMIDDVAAASGGKVIRTPVGEANVAEAMIKNKCVTGGEGNGGVIDLRIGPVRDSLVAMALVLGFMSEQNKSIAELAGQIPAYFMRKQKFNADAKQVQSVFSAAEAAFAGADVNKADGRRFDFPNGWIHLRMSNTEPVMRVIAEAKSEQTLGDYLDAVERICKGITS